MKAVCILSLDCEGKWGLADMLNDRWNRILVNVNLVRVYTSLLELFERYDIRATFAFVAALTFSIDEYRRAAEQFIERPFRGNDWLAAFRQQADAGCFEGWFCPRLLDMVRQSGHEVASHGFCHLPFAEESVAIRTIDNELAALQYWSRLKGVGLSTLVFPRNRKGFLSRLEKIGMIGFRERTNFGCSLFPRRINALLRELNPCPVAQPHAEPVSAAGTIQPVPGGYFFHRRKGGGRCIPQWYTVHRWKKMIDQAIENRTVIHLWTHPHNFLHTSGQLEMLEKVLQYLDRQQRKGKIMVLTQEEYVRYLAEEGRG